MKLVINRTIYKKNQLSPSLNKKKKITSESFTEPPIELPNHPQNHQPFIYIRTQNHKASRASSQLTAQMINEHRSVRT